MKKKHFSEDAALKIYRVATQKDVEIWQEARKRRPNKDSGKKNC